METKEATSEDNSNFLITMKYACKFCNKRYPCGRSLGGHIRSHLISNPSNQEKVNTTTHKKTNGFSEGVEGYELRENPKKRWTEVGSNQVSCDQDPNLLPIQQSKICCKECGKSFHSSKALSSHMKSHAIERDNKREKERVIVVKQKSLFDIDHRLRRSSKSNEEEEEVAMCLILLSKNVDSCGELYDRETEEVRFKRVKESDKRSKHECATCNKIFHSHQALGGHRASHKKTKGCCEISASRVINLQEQDKELNSRRVVDQILQNHECPICFRVFASGQALGGHKRSHLIGQSSSKPKFDDSVEEKSNHEPRDFLDLNQPAPVEQLEVAGLKPWWSVRTTKHQQLVGMN